MINIDLAGLQGIAESFMTTTVAIKHRATAAKDPGDRTGDNTITFEATLTEGVSGWFVDKGTRSFSRDGAMSVVTDVPLLRVPVGTDVAGRDEVRINGNWWVVVDVSNDETWPIWLKCELARIE